MTFTNLKRGNSCFFETQIRTFFFFFMYKMTISHCAAKDVERVRNCDSTVVDKRKRQLEWQYCPKKRQKTGVESVYIINQLTIRTDILWVFNLGCSRIFYDCPQFLTVSLWDWPSITLCNVWPIDLKPQQALQPQVNSHSLATFRLAQ